MKNLMDFCIGTIVSETMAERTKFISYCIYSAVISLLIYPISSRWIWGGVLYGGGFSFLGVQILGVASVSVYVAVAMFIVFKVINATVGLRVSAEEELTGLDMTEHGLVSTYADFSPFMMTSADSMSGGLGDSVQQMDKQHRKLQPFQWKC